MITRTIFEKIARNEPLTIQEQAEFAVFGEALVGLEALWSGNVMGGTTVPRLQRPIIESPTWVGSPLKALIAVRTSVLSVANTTNTYITFDTFQNFGDVWSGNGDKVTFRGVQNKAFQIHGYAIWAGNATGYRGLWLEGFDAANVSLGTSPLHTFAGNNLVDNVLPVSFMFYYNNFDYLKFYVHQSSGGNLNLKALVLGLSLA
jgi:hypothetical protein